MIFNEIYGTYYLILEKLLKEAADGSLDRKKMFSIISENGFSETMAVIPDAIWSGRWPLLDEECRTDIKDPKRPLTELEKMWLKALLDDPRIGLFADDIQNLEKGLASVEPLYEEGFFVHFDRFSDGDDYEDREYIRVFKSLLKAFKEKKKIQLTYSGRKRIHKHVVAPLKLEYSSKDDKFRLIGKAEGNIRIFNLSAIRDIRVLDEKSTVSGKGKSDICEVLLELKDGRNALERAMIQFSDLQKETVKLDDTTYSIRLMYHRTDETEILIRILSFGPMIKVIGPDDFFEKIRERVLRQKSEI